MNETNEVQPRLMQVGFSARKGGATTHAESTHELTDYTELFYFRASWPKLEGKISRGFETMIHTLPVKITFIVSVLLLTATAFADKHAQKRGTPAEAKAMVAKAVTLFDKAGAKSAFERFTNRPGTEFKHADLYIFVLKAEEGARLVAHAQTPSLIGTNATTLIYSNGINIGRALLEGAKPKGAWVDYEWKDPLTGKAVLKSSWVVLHKGHIFGCGVHKQ